MPRTTDHGPRTPFPCRLLIDPPADGAWNMAVDEALLEQAADEGVAALRFYEWREPTLSLGYFQRYAERDTHPASRNAAIVRRLSGGGALMHDRELTYSLCLPASHPTSRQSARLYGLVHLALIDVLAQHGVAAHLAGPTLPAADSIQSSGSASEPVAAEPFLCFARRTSDDILCKSANRHAAPAKITGSAQRRRRGAILQHGAVLLGATPCASELPGILELTGRTIEAAELVDPWSRRLAQSLHLELAPAERSPAADAAAAVVAGTGGIERLVEKFSSSLWSARR